MARRSGVQQQFDEAVNDIGRVKALLEEAYTPEASREDLATAIGEALGVVDQYETDDEKRSSHAIVRARFNQCSVIVNT